MKADALLRARLANQGLARATSAAPEDLVTWFGAVQAQDYLGSLWGIGQRVRVAGYEGNIVDLTAVSLVLETDEGRVTLPGKVFNEEPIVLVMARSGTAGPDA